MVKVKKTEEYDDAYSVRFRHPGNFTRIRTPGWAGDVAESVSKGAQVRMGKTDAGNWYVQSVRITKPGVGGKSHARDLARRIQQKIDD